MEQKEFVVIGLGRFGGTIVKELANMNMNVMAIDVSEEVINNFKDIATEAVIGDSTDEEMLKALGIRNFNHVIVGIGSNIQASILTTLILKELGVPTVTVKAENEYHAKVLHKIGADYIVHPERDMGKRVAHHIISDSVLDYIELSDAYSMIEFKVTKQLINKPIIDLNIRAEYGINIIAIKRSQDIIVSPPAEEYIYQEDILVLLGENKNIARFESEMIE